MSNAAEDVHFSSVEIKKGIFTEPKQVKIAAQ